MKKVNRRHFLYASAITAISTACHACRGKGHQDSVEVSRSSGNRVDPNEGMRKDQIMAMLDDKVDHYMKLSGNCAQTTFLALSEQFGLEEKQLLKALTPLPGIAEKGETCGVVIGALMVMGLLYGRDDLNDWQRYRDSLIPTGEFYDRFQSLMGSTRCGDIVERQFGRRLDLLDPADRQEFLKNDPASKCGEVTKTGVRIAADIILRGSG
jgi:C_GCAxxG_C_C family probable redox protein